MDAWNSHANRRPNIGVYFKAVIVLHAIKLPEDQVSTDGHIEEDVNRQ